MPKSIRNIIIFNSVALGCGWLGLLVDNNSKTDVNGDSLGMGIWLILPLLTVVLLRSFAGDGWKDLNLGLQLQRNLKWYILSILIYPIVTGVILLLGTSLGWIDLAHFRSDLYVQGFTISLLPNFIKNIFEESVWRGYLTHKLIQQNTNDIGLYLIVGAVWGLWHLPYYLYFLPESIIQQILPVDRLTFALIAVASMMCWTVMFIEIYRITQSLWSVILLHTIEDAIVNHLIIDGHIMIIPNKAFLISPISGIITTSLYLLFGLYLRYKRIQIHKKTCL